MPYRPSAQVTSIRPSAATKPLVFPRTVQPPQRRRAPAARRIATGRPWHAAVWEAVALTGLLLAGPALAFDPPSTSTFGEEAMAALQAQTRATPSAYEVQSIVMPQLGEGGVGTPSMQRPVGSAGAWTASNATQHTDITRWLTPDAPASVGFSLGLSSAAPSAAASLANANANASANSFANGAAIPSSLDLGVRWRSRLTGGRHLDVSAWAQTPQWGPSPDALGLIWQQQQQPVYGTRVEMQWASSKTRGLVPEFGAVGVQLQGGSRLVLRARKGGPMLYYRAKF